MLQPEPGQVAFYPLIDAIQEFTIESNSARAEFGRFNGGVINLTTKGGTNAFHGSGFEFLRHETLNAGNVFQSTNPVKPDYRRNQFGGTLGGPLAKDHTFFFVDYQGQRQAIGRTVTSTVPTLLQRQGIFTEPIGGRVPVIYDPATTVGSTRTAFAGATIPRSRMDPVALALLHLVGDPRLPADRRTPSQWFNTAAFAIAPVFTLGSASRNPVRGPSYRNVDVALIRRVPIRGATAIELRAEVFNLFNTSNLGAPNGVAGGASFGTITSALDPRVAQLAVKLLF